jgi:hypothetical protein
MAIDTAQLRMAPAATAPADDAPGELLQATYPPDILPMYVAMATDQAHNPVDDPSSYPPPPPPPSDTASGDATPPDARETIELQAPVYPPDILPLLVAKATGQATLPVDDPSLYPPPPPPPDDVASGSAADAPADAPPVNVDVPYVAQDGDVLSCTMGNWTGEPVGYAYQWTLDGVAAGGDDPTLTVTADDIGKTAVCVVTASNAAGATEAPPSNEITVASMT